MSDPFSERVLESARMNHIMSMFWDKDSVNSVQRWEHSGARVFEFDCEQRDWGDLEMNMFIDIPCCSMACVHICVAFDCFLESYN